MNWVILRGLAREKRHWGQFPQMFESHIQGSKVFCMELPGVGEKLKQTFPLQMEDTVNLLKSEFDFLKKSNSLDSCSLVGVSMGGMLAMKWCELYPEDFKKLVLINTSAKNCSYPWQRMQPQAMMKSFKIFFTKDTQQREDLVLSMVSQLKGAERQRVLEQWTVYADQKKMHPSNFIRQLLAAAIFSAPKSLNLPLLILSSLSDKMVNPQCSESLFYYFKKTNKNTTHWEKNQESGHDLPLDSPEWVIEKIKNFSD